MGRLENKIAIITGGSSGIGREAALLMAGEGATVIAVGRRQGPLDEVVAEIEAAGGKCVARSVDLLDGDAAAELGTWAEAEYGRVDVLVNNAGYSSTVRSIRYVPADEWNEVFTINVEAVYRLTQSLLQGMIDRGEGTVITVSSMAALNPGPLGGAPYSAAQSGLADHHEVHQHRTPKHRSQGEHHRPGRGRHPAYRQAGGEPSR